MSKFDRVLSDAELISATFKVEVEGTMGELRAVEQAVLAKLAEQEPVAIVDYFDGVAGVKKLSDTLPKGMKLYAHPMPCVSPTQDKNDRQLARQQPCGCVVCYCENQERCLGCGAKYCGTHEIDETPNAVYVDHIADASKMVGSDHIPDIWQMIPEGYALAQIEPTDEINVAARDWSIDRYGKAIGFDSSRGCYQVMLAAAPKYTGESK